MMISHIVEHETDGTWDYVPQLDVKISKEN